MVVRRGNHEIQSRIAIPAATTFYTASGTSLLLSGGVQGAGSLSKQGLGLLEFSGSAPANTGNLEIVDGTFLGIFTSEGGSLRVTSDAGLNHTLTLNATAANNYRGGTDLVSGVVAIGRNDSLSSNAIRAGAGGAGQAGLSAFGGNRTLANAIQIADGSDLTILGTNNLTLNGVVSGNGSLVKRDTGTLFLRGNNTYTAGTRISGGTVDVTSDAQLGAGSGLLTLDGGTLQTSGPGSTYARSIRVTSAGGALVDAGFAVQDFSGPISLEGTLRLGGPFTLRLLGDLAGTGGLEADTAQSVFLGGNSTYSGDTLVSTRMEALQDGAFSRFSHHRIASDGRLLVNPGGTQEIGLLSGEGEVLVGGNLTMGGLGANSVFSGNFTGSGNLVKAGGGAFRFTGAGSFNGTTTVDGGAFLVDGLLGASLTTVNAGGLLGGSGTLAGDVAVRSGGILSPGNSPALLTIGGNLVLDPGSRTVFEINGTTPGTEHDQIVVGSEARLAGTLDLQLGYVPTAGQRLTLINAQTVNGTFDNVTNSLGNALGFDLLYDNPAGSGDVVLSIVVIQNPFLPFALTRNQQAVAANLDTTTGDRRVTDLVNALNSLPGPALPAAFDQIAPDELGAMSRMAEIRAGSSGFSGGGFAIYDRQGRIDLKRNVLLASAETTSPDVHGRRPWLRQTPDNPWGLFVAGTGQFGAVQGDGNADGYDFTTGGLTVGADYRALPSLVVGAMLGYAGSSADLDAGGGDIGADGARFGLYASWFEPRGAGWYLNAAANGGATTYDTRRRVLGALQEGETTGTEFTAYLGGGYDARAARLESASCRSCAPPGSMNSSTAAKSSMPGWRGERVESSGSKPPGRSATAPGSALLLAFTGVSPSPPHSATTPN